MRRQQRKQIDLFSIRWNDDLVQIGRTMHAEDVYQTEFEVSVFFSGVINISKFEIHFDEVFKTHEEIHFEPSVSVYGLR